MVQNAIFILCALIRMSIMNAPLFAQLAMAQDVNERQRPVAIVPHGVNKVLVGNRDTGRIAIVDIRGVANSVSFTEPIARQISDMVRLDDDTFLVADPVVNELITVGLKHGRATVRDRHAVDATPVRIAVSPSRKTVAVACLWARRVRLFSVDRSGIDGGIRITARHLADLGFSPRELLFLSDAELIVGDAFGSRLVVIDPREASAVLSTATIPGHNIRGLAIEPDTGRLMVTHQLLNEFLPTARDHVFWGNVMTNLMRFIVVNGLRDNGTAEGRIHGAIYPLGQEKNGAGDPARVLATKSGHVVSLLSGVGQIGVRAPNSRDFQRVDVGKTPVAICEIHSTPHLVAIANKFGDSVSIVDLQQTKLLRTIPLNGNVETSVVDQGEELFYDASISLDGWFSCHSCHTDGHSCDLLNDNLGDDSFGSPKRILSLLGAEHTSPWAWNGSQHRLADQVRKSMKLTMHGNEQRSIHEHEVAALTAYVQSLSFPPGVDAARQPVEDFVTHRAHRGKEIFAKLNCAECHAGMGLTSTDVRSVGLADEPGLELNPPSLRGISQRQAWLHDGRARSLRDVFEGAGHQGLDELPREDLDLLIHYLRSL